MISALRRWCRLPTLYGVVMLAPSAAWAQRDGDADDDSSLPEQLETYLTDFSGETIDLLALIGASYVGLVILVVAFVLIARAFRLIGSAIQ